MTVRVKTEVRATLKFSCTLNSPQTTADNTSNMSSRCDSKGNVYFFLYHTYQARNKEWDSRCHGNLPARLSCCSDVSVRLAGDIVPPLTCIDIDTAA